MESKKEVGKVGKSEKSKGKGESSRGEGKSERETGRRGEGEEEEEEEGGGGEIGEGRPMNVERLIRERANSMPLLEMSRRREKKQERQEEEREMEGIEAFRKSTKVERSLVRGVGGGWEDIVREMRMGFREIMSEMRELREGMKVERK